ncbi:polymeric immunoglobulin receptor-like [Chanodichthys erythropterus]|uniref:polymeric immunoglobulin receptor-like n=1 Tax=Chanodichthys erythropterus TaxID=933992 RepID=UPI00351E1374
MWDVLLLFSSICTAVVVGAPVTVKGHRGERVEIRCSYESGYESNSKYFCKGECIFGNRNFMVKSGSPAQDERFSLTDDKKNRVFTVTITDLRTEDEGQYWCGVEKRGPDVLSEIMLLVKYVVVVGAPDTVTGHRGERVEIRCPYEHGYESNLKYFCKGKCIYGNRNFMVKSGSPAQDKRFSLTDDTTNRVFNVTITDLRTEDEGQYWCGVEKTGPDVLSEIMLLVKYDEKPPEVSTIRPFSKKSTSSSSSSSSLASSSSASSYFRTTELNLQSTSMNPSGQTVHHGAGRNVIVIAATSGGLFIIIIIVIFTIQKKRINRRSINEYENVDPSAGTYAALDLRSRSSDLYGTLTLPAF